jgi:hypothetical protein
MISSSGRSAARRVRASGKLSPQKRIFMKDYYNFPDDQCIGQYLTGGFVLCHLRNSVWSLLDLFPDPVIAEG